MEQIQALFEQLSDDTLLGIQSYLRSTTLKHIVDIAALLLDADVRPSCLTKERLTHRWPESGWSMSAAVFAVGLRRIAGGCVWAQEDGGKDANTVVQPFLAEAAKRAELPTPLDVGRLTSSATMKVRTTSLLNQTGTWLVVLVGALSFHSLVTTPTCSFALRKPTVLLF
jgi:hypothetical protein